MQYTDIGIDLGTASILVYIRGKGVVLKEPSVVAFDRDTNKIKAIGEDARLMLGRTPGNIIAIRPLRQGVISDYKVTEKMMKYFIQKAIGKRTFRKPRIAVCVPSGVTEVERKAVQDATEQAGAREVFIIEEPIAAAIGAGIDIYKPCGNMIVDIGGGSIQISLFDKDKLMATQNMKLGVLRIRETLRHLDAGKSKYEALVTEMANSQLAVFKKLYLKDKRINNVIILDDYINALVQKNYFSGKVGEQIEVKTLEKLMKTAAGKSSHELTKVFDMPEESVELLYISYLLLKRIIEVMDVEMLWAPGVTLCDGIAYEYAQGNKVPMPDHDFEQDIIACAQNISKRYMGSKKRGETLEKIALTIFDSMKKVHGLGARERLLLRLATLLHDCGKYISMVNLGECSYSIIMATEMIGLSHMEREIVANVVKFNHEEFEYYDVAKASTLDPEAYLKIAKLTAILRIANGLDRSHKQKFKDVKSVLKENVLTITVETGEDITLEKGMFWHRADFFEEVYSVKPLIKQKKNYN